MEPREALVLAFSLFTLFNPPSAIAPFITLSRRFPQDIQRLMARRVALGYALVLVVSAWAGRWLLEMLGISLASLRLTGGLVLMLAALPMVLRKEDVTEEAGQELKSYQSAGKSDWRVVATLPLTFPIAIGGATLATVITAASPLEDFVRPLVVSGVCLAMSTVVWATFRFAPVLARRLGKVGMDVLTLAGGTILLCIAFQLLAMGLKELLPGLSR